MTHFAASKRLWGQTFQAIRTASTSSSSMNSAPAPDMIYLYKRSLKIEFKTMLGHEERLEQQRSKSRIDVLWLLIRGFRARKGGPPSML